MIYVFAISAIACAAFAIFRGRYVWAAVLTAAGVASLVTTVGFAVAAVLIIAFVAATVSARSAT